MKIEAKTKADFDVLVSNVFHAAEKRETFAEKREGEEMNTVKRVMLFETNSSSSHSFSIDGDPVAPETLTTLPIEEEDGKCHVFPGEFSLEVAEYIDAATKASYLYTYIMTCKEGKVRDQMMERLRSIIAKRMKCQVVFEKMSGEEVYYQYGYIDHQSEDEPADILSEDDDAVDRFIFSCHSILRTDNDNH